MTTKKKKVILLIVEGGTEAESFQDFINDIERDRAVIFHLIRGDIATREGINDQNCISYINNELKDFEKTNTDKIKLKDIIEIVHLVDLDGTYIEEDDIIEDKDIKKITYRLDKIITKNKFETIKRFKTKSSVLNKLAKTSLIKNITYSIYYSSRNLEHVLHDKIESNLTNREKIKMAYKFRKKFNGDVDEFIKFMSESEFAVEGTHSETWSYIRVGNRSLKRYSNFHLYIKRERKSDS